MLWSSLVNMDLIKIEPNTDGDIQPTFILAEVQDEQNCFTVMKTESLHNFQLISLECDTGIYELAAVCDVKRDGHEIPLPITFAPVKSETEVGDGMSDVEWKDEVKSHDRVVQLINPVGDVPKETFPGRLDSGVHYQHEEYLIPYLHNGGGDDQLIRQPDGVSEGIPLVKHDSNIVYEEEHAACDICNGSGEEPSDVPESRSSVRLDSSVNSQEEYVTCDVCNGSGYLMHGLPVTKKIHPC